MSRTQSVEHRSGRRFSFARLLGVSRSTIYKYVPELGRRAALTGTALDVVVAALPEDTQPPPDVTK